MPIKKYDDKTKTLLELCKTKNILNLWSSRDLTSMGKITIIKCLVIPHVIYKASILPLINQEFL